MRKAETPMQVRCAERAMELASQRGVDPYDSHPTQAKKYKDCMRMAGVRCRSEAAANAYMREFLEG